MPVDRSRKNFRLLTCRLSSHVCGLTNNDVDDNLCNACRSVDLLTELGFNPACFSSVSFERLCIFV